MKKLMIVAGLALFMAPVLAKDPNFSLKNKTDRDLFVQVEESSFGAKTNNSAGLKINNIKSDLMTRNIFTGIYEFGTPVLIRANRSMVLDLADNKMYRLSVYFDDNYAAKKIELATPFELTNGSTFYVKFQRDKKTSKYTIMVQEGGVFGKTTEGFSLKNNVQSDNLNPIGVEGKVFSDLNATFKEQDVLDFGEYN